MTEPTTQQSETDRQWVQNFLAAIIRNAEMDADRVAAFLKMRGLKPRRKSKRPAPAAEKPTGPVADILLNIAAALRLHSWERAGLTAHLPEGLPTAADALAAAADSATQTDSPTNPRTEIPLTVFRTLIERFAQDGQVHIGTDIVLDTKCANDFLDNFAAFLLAASAAITSNGKEQTQNDWTTEESR